MSNFKNFVIPNSSFAWWAAWLSEKNNKIITVPDKWSGLVNQEYIDIAEKRLKSPTRKYKTRKRNN